MRKKIPSLHALASFDAAARHQSYTLAAQELSLTQSAVSRQIGGLEAFLGVALFRRARHGVVLTEAGTQYARQIAPRLQALERDTLEAMAGHNAGAAGGAVTLAAVPTLAARWLVPRLPDFARAHPDVVVHLEARTRPFMFADAQIDAALYAGTPAQMAQWAGTHSVQLMPEVVVPVCAPRLMQGREDLSPQDLAALPLLQQSTRTDAWRQWFAAAGLANDSATLGALAGPRYEQFSMSAAAAACGMGVALIPSLLIEAELARGELVIAHALPLPGARFYYWVQPDGVAARPALQALLQWLQQLSAAAAGLRAAA
ncbi:MAG: LysR family transcriptional regulator [Burkholderiales bacterium PBB4]|nr:MAG: LysR family transcriptional regulator [Burkholderiales bacterium PBB4]